MKKRNIAMMLIVLFVGCRKGNSTSGTNPQTAEAILSPTGGTAVSGKLTFITLPDGRVRLTMEVNVPANAGKSVAVHIHEHGECGNAGDNAHGHWNPTGEPHGSWTSNAHHSGDIGNISLDPTGKGGIVLTTNRWTIGGDSTKNILNRGVIVHAGVDDHTSQPGGNAGARIGCGVITIKN